MSIATSILKAMRGMRRAPLFFPSSPSPFPIPRSPLCIALVALCAASAQAATTAAYVQDGLIACWDGIENAGSGQHNANAAVWKDVVGGYEFNLNNVTVDADRMTFSGVMSGSRAISYGVLSAADTTSSFVAAKDGTLEIVYRSSSTAASQVFLQAPDSSGIAFGIWNTSSILNYSHETQNNKSAFTFTSGTATNCVSVRYTSCAPVTAIANGSALSTSASASYWLCPSGETQAYVGARASRANNPFAGSIYCIRLYSRQLTDAEIAANHEIDNKRFFLQIDESTLYVSSSPVGVGSPSPALGTVRGLAAGETRAVSCGSTAATNAAGTHVYSCTGWKLYDGDGNVVSNGTETSFTYTHPTPAATRELEWQWVKTASASTIYDAMLPVEGAAFHVDASLPLTMTTVEAADGRQLVTEWRDADGLTMKATAGTSGRPCIVTTNGLPYMDFGPFSSSSGDAYGRLSWSSQLTTIREVFLVYSDYPGSNGSFFLGDSSNYHFHRDGKKLFNNSYASANIKNGLIEVDGVVRAISYELPDGFHIIHLRTTDNVTASRFAQDRTSRYGGQRLQEVIVYTSALTDAEAEDTYDYLYDKWFHNPGSLEVCAMPEQLGSPSPSYGEHVGLAAGQTVSVSCDATLVTNAAGRAYACAGWKLYDSDGNEVSAGTGASFTYIHPSPTAYRTLEWQWVEPLVILPIPNQTVGTFDLSRPEFVVSNIVTGATWTLGGDIVSPLFDVEYANNDGAGVATVSVTGKGAYTGTVANASFTIVAANREDENISTTDTTARRLTVNGKSVYIFSDPNSAKTVTAKRGIFLTDCLLVGGGGGGGHEMAGGGGGGGVTNATGLTGILLSKGGTFTLTVGVGGTGSSSASFNGGNGGATSLQFGEFSASVLGGGGGASWGTTTKAGSNGASGGGGCQDGVGGAGIDGQGFAGAAGGGKNSAASGGGGGAGHAGYAANTSSRIAGYGGEGVSNNITGAWVVYGGGGGGGGASQALWWKYDAGLGGLGGGGDGGKTTAGANGVDGLGGGGGGGGADGSGTAITDKPGGNGGSGVVILAILPADFEINPIPDQMLVDGGSEPLPVVRDGETLLTKDTDYTLSYANNTQSGMATVTITGINDYAGKSAVVSFKVYSVIFAKPDAVTGGDGTSWAAAVPVADALADAATWGGLCEVWITAGTLSAPEISIVNNANLTIRGGFAGTETTLAERQPGALTVFDGATTAAILLSVENAADANLTIERLKFCNARSNGFVKTGGGSLTVLDCVVEANGRNVSTVYGRGINAQSDGLGSLVVSNCVFAGNRSTSGDKQYGGFGLYAKSFASAVVDDSLFVTNGYDLTIQPGKNYAGYLYARGSAILAENTPITVRNSRFAGNCCPVRKSNDYWCGGTIALEGSCGGSVIENCALIGNTGYASAGYEASYCGGAIAVRMGSSVDKAKVKNCTIAYNLTHCSQAAGGITVARGDVEIENTVLWKNARYHYTTSGYGTDVHVGSTGTASIRHSLVTTLDGTALTGTSLAIDEDTVFAADPLLVTPTAAFESLLTVTETAQYYMYTNSAIYANLATMDAHLLSPAGYLLNNGSIGPATSSTSPAIDVGDPAADYSREPAPNGSRLNLGAYGNTAEASRTVIGQPSANVEVVFPDGIARPVARVTMGLESGTGYFATVHVVCSADGVTLKEETYHQVVNGDVLELLSPVYLPNGAEFDVAVTITAPGAETASYTVSEIVEGTYPPFYGKGGGPNVIHVRTGADCAMDGTSWTDAYPSLDAALASAPDASKTEVWLSVTNDHLSAALTLANSLTIRGGFTGAENTPAERPEGLLAHLWGNDYYKNLEVVVPAGQQLTVERVNFTHAVASELKKTGAGDLVVSNCWFTDSRSDGGAINGRGISASGGGTVTIANCHFLNLLGPNSSGDKGTAIYLASCAQAYVDNCLFITNGTAFKYTHPNWSAQDGAAAYVSSTPTIFRNCHFAACCSVQRYDYSCGGIVYFTGASGGSKLVNCAFTGNGDFESGNTSNMGYGGGAIDCNMSTQDATLDIENCTVALNLTQGLKSAAGINVCKGTVNLKNSIVYGNIRGRPDNFMAGADIDVKADATLNISYSLVTGLTTNYVGNAGGAGIINWGAGVIAGDPLLATTTNALVSILATNANIQYIPVTATATVAAFDVHPRTRTGYLLDGVLVCDPEKVESPTIDAGDPASDYSLEPVVPGVGGNGHRVNLGAYGNTPEAALSKIRSTMIILR